MTMHSTQWGFIVKFLYKQFRPTLLKAVQDSSNTLDDNVIKILDTLAGV